MKRLFAKSVVNVFLLTLFISGYSFAGGAQKWNLDKAHTSINFSINHFVTPVHGNFEDYDIDINFDPENLDESSIKVSIQVASVNTGWGPRDSHLRTADWFDANKYRKMSFKSSKIMDNGNKNYVAKGKLKIKDVETEVEIPFILLGINKIKEDMRPLYDDMDEVASFAIHFSLNREDYNVGTGTATQGKAYSLYRKFVGNEVDIYIAVEANRKAS